MFEIDIIEGDGASIIKPGFFKMPDAIYHRDPAPAPSLGSTQAKVIVAETPAHARLTSPRLKPDYHFGEPSKMMDIGSAAHALIAEDYALLKVFAFPDWREGRAQRAKEATRAQYKTPLLKADLEIARAMADKARPVFEEFFGEDRFHEIAVFAQAGDVWLRGKVDVASRDFSIIGDYKTTSASVAPEEFQRGLFSGGAHIQERLYRDAVHSLIGGDATRKFIFIAQEQADPFEISVFEVDEVARHVARGQVDHAVKIWGQCLRLGEWPGYPRRINTAQFPTWLHNQWTEREFALATIEANAYGKEKARLESSGG